MRISENQVKISMALKYVRKKHLFLQGKLADAQKEKEYRQKHYIYDPTLDYFVDETLPSEIAEVRRVIKVLTGQDKPNKEDRREARGIAEGKYPEITERCWN